MAKRNNRVKSAGDLELKERLVAINRVTKVTVIYHTTLIQFNDGLFQPRLHSGEVFFWYLPVAGEAAGPFPFVVH